MLDLFETPPIPGLRLQHEFISSAAELALIHHIDCLDMAPFRYQQWTGKRLAHSFGWHYDFQAQRVEQAADLPEWLLPLRDDAAQFAAVEASKLEQALLLKYGPGAGISWHKDRPNFDKVLGISLGEPAAMRFRRKVNGRWQRVLVPLAPRSIYLLTGEVRHEWEHSIVEMKEGTRYSVTFRSLAAA